MDNCLIIGNGINRPYTDQSWTRIIDELARNRNIDRDCEYIPLPLEFERIMNHYMKNNSGIKTQDAYSRAKKFVAKKVSQINLPQNAVHHELLKLSLDSIVTANYDFLLENEFGITNPNVNCVGKRSYIAGCTSSSLNGVKFFHPHGVISNPSTICLGYVNYVKICSDLQDKIATKQNNRNTEMRILRHLRGTNLINDYWCTKLYDSNCAFIGFGLDTCEIDFWWLLSHRASIINQKIGGAERLVNNTIVYYDIIDNSADCRENNETIEKFILKQVKKEIYSKKRFEKYKLLESMNVIVKVINISNGNQYADAYKAIIDDIYKNGIDQNVREISL